MSNVRKQTIIISVLVVLIACAGWFANSFNQNVKDTNAISDKVTIANKTMNFFADSRIQKDSSFTSSKEDLNGIVKNKELSKKAREEASSALVKLVKMGNQESKIETLVKERGFEDALCIITNKNVEVCVKTPVNISAEQVHQIKEIVVNTTEFSPSNIYIKSKQ
jgi:stage III sporulation protein AH